jgi:hypothetical protein
VRKIIHPYVNHAFHLSYSSFASVSFPFSIWMHSSGESTLRVIIRNNESLIPMRLPASNNFFCAAYFITTIITLIEQNRMITMSDCYKLLSENHVVAADYSRLLCPYPAHHRLPVNHQHFQVTQLD